MTNQNLQHNKLTNQKPKKNQDQRQRLKRIKTQLVGNGGLFSGKRGHHGTSSQMVEKNEETKFVKRSIIVVSAVRKDETQAKVVIPKIQDIKFVAKRRNGCHFCGKIGHSVAFYYSWRNQTERV